MPRPTSNRRNFAEYTQMLEDSSARLQQIEGHLRDLVYVNKRADARQVVETRRIVQPLADQQPITLLGVSLSALRWEAPQGEAWEALSLRLVGAATSQFYWFLGVPTASQLAYVQTSDANGYAATTGNAHLYIPERVRLYLVGSNLMGANIHVKVFKRVAQTVSAEEAYALRGPETEYETREVELRPMVDEAGEPEPERHVQDEHGGMGFPEEQVRPTPHLSEELAAIAHKLEETFTDLT